MTLDRFGRKHAPARYPVTLQTMVEQSVADRIRSEADDLGLSRGEVTRTYIEAGMAAVDAMPDEDES